LSDDAVTADITIDAPPREVWDLVMDPERLGDWVTIHRKLESADAGPPRAGMKMKQRLCLRGASFNVTWELTESQDGELAVWEGRGPVRSKARTEYHLTENADGGTNFHYVNEFTAPGGPLGKAASKALVGGLPQREAEKSLARLKELLEGK
jgi:uncharacterized protein YndB with AHSA1/START domain